MITDFLSAEALTFDDAATALRVLRLFKKGENVEEWMRIPFAAWTKLEQLEEYLVYLVDGGELDKDTLEYLAEHGCTVPPRKVKP